VGALQLTHAIVPPTPGPLAAAALVGADIGKTIIFGSIACLGGAVAGWIFGQFLAGPRLKTLPDEEFRQSDFLTEQEGSPLPSTLSSYAPIAVPVLLISAQSVGNLFLEEGTIMREVLGFVGWPVVALTIGLWLAFRNIGPAEDKTKTKNQWVKDGLKTSAMILVVTGLGGSLSEILKGTPAVEFVADLFASYGLPSILLPFVLGIIGNLLTGSTTVGVITAASLAAPMLAALGLSPEAAMLSGASGSVITKYVNSSYFWVCSSLSKMEVREALLGYGGVTLVGGVASFAIVWIMWAAGLV
jgi:GntP family gluconate:H+ symporter